MKSFRTKASCLFLSALGPFAYPFLFEIVECFVVAAMLRASFNYQRIGKIMQDKQKLVVWTSKSGAIIGQAMEISSKHVDNEITLVKANTNATDNGLYSNYS